MLSKFFHKPIQIPINENEIVEEIKIAEKKTSGEIRLYIESKNPYINPLHRAAEVFDILKMNKTENKNAVLVYLAYHHKEFALFADQGIFEKYSVEEWEILAQKMQNEFINQNVNVAILIAIKQIGEWLSEKYPYNQEVDKNELPDEIVFGK